MDAPDTEKMSIVFVGHVDHGKSSVVGRLLADTGALPLGKLEQIQAYCEQNSLPFEYAFLIDALKDERRQNITIDAARVFFKSPRRSYIIIDAPGHIEFVKNMVTGAARAEAALLVIDAREGVQENSRRHGNLLSMLGVRQLVVLVNKMDLVDYDRERFAAIQQEASEFLASVGLQPSGFIPVSARDGDNIGQPGTHMPWYQGPTVLQALDAFEKDKPLTDQPFRMPVQDIYRFTAFGDDRRIIAGTVASGSAAEGDALVFYPSGKHSTLRRMETFGNPAQSPPGRVIHADQAAGFTLAQQIYIKRGEIAARIGEPPPQTARRLRVSLFWLGSEPLTVKKTYTLKLGTSRTRCHVEKVMQVLDAASLARDSEKTQVDRHEMAECILALDHPIAFDPAQAMPAPAAATSRFVLVDGYEIRGGGIIREGLPDAEAQVRAQVRLRNERWITGGVTPEARAERLNQRACLVIITGKKGAGRKRLARLLEERLFQDGKQVYYLGMGSVVYGVDADIATQPDGKGRFEHVRRMAEIANLFLDAGLILIVTAVELAQSDLKLFHAIIDARKIEVVWVGDEISTDIHCDLPIASADVGDPAVLAVKQMLRDHGILFRP